MPSTNVIDDAFVFPEDSGTNTNIGLQGGDWYDAGNFAAAFHAIGLTDTVVGGLELDPDYQNSELTVRPGAAVVTTPTVGTVDHAGDGGRGAVERGHGGAFVVQLNAEQAGLPLSVAGTQHVYLTADLTGEDAASIHIDQDQTPPAPSSVRIGEVDMDENTSTVVNRRHRLSVATPTDESDATTKAYVDNAVSGAETTYGAREQRSGDGSQRTFAFSHGLGVIPSAVDITPASEDAVGQHYLSSKDAAGFEITYAEERPAGSNNLVFEVLAVR